MLDHLVWAAPSLQDACALFEQLSGIAPKFGGEHTTGGTWNSLVSLGARQYLEVVAPNPRDSNTGDWKEDFLKQSAPRLYTFCISPPKGVEALARSMQARGVRTSGPYADGRRRPDGVELRWKLLVPQVDGLPLPFFIEWDSPQHPGESSPPGCRIRRFEVAHPQADRLRELYAWFGCGDIPVHSAAEFTLLALLETPRGSVVLT